MTQQPPAEGGAEDSIAPAVIDTSVAHQSRIYDYWLGGKDNFAVDREAAEQAIAAYPPIVRGVRAQRAFLARVVQYLAGLEGILQFLDTALAYPPRTTPTRSHRTLRRPHGWFTSTTTPWC